MNIILLIFSIILIASFGLANLIYILISAITTYFAALNHDKKHKKLIFIGTIILNVSILIFFKFVTYNKFFNLIDSKNILVPLGISYYTFQVLAYLIDVYKGKIKPQKNLFNYLLFVSYFPYLIIGPINRYSDLSKTLYQKKKIEKDNILNGLVRITWGLFKKYVIAARIALVVTTITANLNYQGAYVLLALLLYSFELYADFSGGIDIVLGFSKMLGIILPENFDKPYLSRNLKEFWRRWHISLSSWFRDYIYIPLGGSKCSNLRKKINVIITFIVSGLWHGINYFFWGLFHGLIVAFQNKPSDNYKTLKIILNFIIVSLLWIFFIYPNSITSFKMLITIFYKFNYLELFSNILNLGLDIPNIVILIISLVLLVISDIKYEKLTTILYNNKDEVKLIFICLMILIVLLLGVYGLGFNTSDFIYSKF